MFYRINKLINLQIHHGKNLVIRHPTNSSHHFFGAGRGLNPGPYIYYALSLPTELSLRGRGQLISYCVMLRVSLLFCFGTFS